MTKAKAPTLTRYSLTNKDEIKSTLRLIHEIKKEWQNDQKLVGLLDEVEEKVMQLESLLRENTMITVDIDFRLEVIIVALSQLVRRLWNFFTG